MAFSSRHRSSNRHSSHRHTVPNSDYSSFPCYQEEINLKTNVECGEGSSGGGGGGDHRGEAQSARNQSEEIQVNVSMHDKLKMCFAEMENMKHQFDNRRQKVLSKRRAHMNWTAPEQQHDEQRDTAQHEHVRSQRPQDSQTAQSTLISIDTKHDDRNRFEARLVRTSSRDSFDDHCEKASAQADGGRLKHQRRTYSEPFGDHILMNEIKRSGKTNWIQEQTRVRKEYDDWVSKLEEINDMSQSTITRIRKLENEVRNLKALTSQTTTTQDGGKSGKTFTSRIPQPMAYSARCKEMNKTDKDGARCKEINKTDKAINTDIDMKFMNDLLSKWKDKKTSSTQTVAELPVYMGTAQRRTAQPIRRLTTTIGRSVEIQTELATESRTSQTEFEDNKQDAKMFSILDMPNVEEQFVFKPSTPQPTFADKHFNTTQSLFGERYTKTPEPIVEIQSDSEDTNFDDFEKNIYSEISRRAMITNKIINRKVYDSKKTKFDDDDDDLDEFRLKNSSTQTKEEEPKQDYRSGPKVKPSNAGGGKGVINKKLNTTSRITIERCHYDQKEKSEILLKTNIDDKGKVHRVTEVKNSKYAHNHKHPQHDHKARRDAKPSQASNYGGNNDTLRKIYSEINICPSDPYLSRPMSENDVFLGEELAKQQNNHDGADFGTKKAYSTMDLCSKSPVASEGYHSELIDPYSNYSHRETPTDEYVLKPPQSFQNEERYWDRWSRNHVTSKTVEEALEPLRDYEFDKNNLVTLTNETLVDNSGKQTNITTKSRTIRKYKPNGKTTSMAELPLYHPEARAEVDTRSSTPVNQSVSEYNLHDLDNTPHYPSEQMQVGTSKACNVSLVYNCNNLVFRADLGFLRLPAYETDL